jgi:hypothetical protein
VLQQESPLGVVQIVVVSLIIIGVDVHESRVVPGSLVDSCRTLITVNTRRARKIRHGGPPIETLRLNDGEKLPDVSADNECIGHCRVVLRAEHRRAVATVRTAACLGKLHRRWLVGCQVVDERAVDSKSVISRVIVVVDRYVGEAGCLAFSESAQASVKACGIIFRWLSVRLLVLRGGNTVKSGWRSVWHG